MVNKYEKRTGNVLKTNRKHKQDEHGKQIGNKDMECMESK